MNPATEQLFDAITDASVPRVRLALAQGADVNARHPLGQLTPLHLVCWLHGKRTFRSFRRSPETEQITEILLEAGADPTARDGMGDLAKRAGMNSSCHMPAAWCEGGDVPRCLVQRMAELTAAQRWPEPEVDGSGNPANGGKMGSYVARNIYRRDRFKDAA